MGLFRKTVSISTLGAVRYRSSGEDTARAARAQRKAAKYSRQTRNAARVGAASAVYGNYQNSRAWRQDQDDRQLAFNQEAWEQQAMLQQQAHLPPTDAPYWTPGWYLDPYDTRYVTWWNGQSWDPQTKRLAH